MKTPPVERLTIEGPVPRLAALLDRPSGRASAWVLLAHGAGASMESPFLEAVAQGLARRDLAVLRFAYPYMQRRAEDGRRRPPDRAPVLLAAHRAALGALRELAQSAPVVLAGKSLGGRMASHLCAEGEPLAGAAFLGFPLHPAGRPEKAEARTEHFPRITAPTLFLQGTRDPLAPLERLGARLALLAGPTSLRVIEGADHDFALLRSVPAPPEGMAQHLADAIADWVRGL